MAAKTWACCRDYLSALTLSIVVTGNFYLWHVYRLDLPIASICILILVLTVLNLAYGYLRENASKRLLKGMFNQYVPQAHIDRMLADPEAYQFSGESKELTVLFADIRSFYDHLGAPICGRLKIHVESIFYANNKDNFLIMKAPSINT